MTQPPSPKSTQLTEAQVRHVAKLSRLTVTDDQVQRFAKQLTDVLEHVATLNKLDVGAIEPMAHALDMTNVLRDDEPQPGLAVEAVLANAPGRSDPFFKVPKVLDDGSGA